jgi:hypothetical protein
VKVTARVRKWELYDVIPIDFLSYLMNSIKVKELIGCFID